MQLLKNQPCPLCHKNKLTLSEQEYDVPYFGKCYLMSMSCENCEYKMSGIEANEKKDPVRYTFEIKNKKDLSVRVIKSAQAIIKIPALKMSVEPGPASEGYISNIEGVLQRFKKIIEAERDTTDDEDIKKVAKNLLKKLWKVELGEMPVKIIIEDPSGNSAIIDKRATVEKLKVKSLV
ncbi:MAG: ZPR1 zinc finger domain-containing protein [Nanoarchaeota archaeon]